MERTIKVYTSGRNMMELIKEATVQEAKEILADTYARGGLVVDSKTYEVIQELDPKIEEILIINLLGGGG